MRHPYALLGSLTALTVVSCSLVNRFDKLNDVPAAQAGTGGAGGSSSGGVDMGGSDAGEPGTAGANTGTGGTGTDEGGANEGGAAGDDTAGAAATGGSGGSGGGVALPDGLVLLAGTDSTSAGVVSVLSPYTGSELQRIKAPAKYIAGVVVYDSIADLWEVIWESSGDPFSTSTPARLDILRIGLDGTVTTLSKTQVPAPASAFLVAPLRDRLLYVARAGNPLAYVFALIGTKDPTVPIQLSGSQPIPVPADLDPAMGTNHLTGMLARPNTSSTVEGGTVTLITQGAFATTGCTNDTPPKGVPPNACAVRALGATVDATSKGPSLDVVSTSGYPLVGYVSATNNGAAGWAIEKGNGGGSDVFFLPPLDFATDDTAQMLEFNPFSHVQQNAYTFSMKGPHVSSAAFDPCTGVGFAGELATARSLYAIPTATGGTPSTTGISQTVNLIVFEPFTRSVIRLFQDPTTPTLDAWSLEGDETTPTLKARPATGKNAWAPPMDVNPTFVVVKDPQTPPCN